MLDQGAQRVAVRGDKHRLSVGELRDDVVVPVRQGTIEHVLEAFGARQQLWWQLRVTGVIGLGVRGVVGQGRRWGVVGAAPDHELLFAVLLAGLGLVLALQGTVVALVQPPGALDRKPEQVGGLQREICGADGALEQGGVQDVRGQALLFQQFTASPGFLLTGRGEVDVHPAGEQPLRVPDTLAVSQ